MCMFTAFGIFGVSSSAAYITTDLVYTGKTDLSLYDELGDSYNISPLCSLNDESITFDVIGFNSGGVSLWCSNHNFEEPYLYTLQPGDVLHFSVDPLTASSGGAKKIYSSKSFKLRWVADDSSIYRGIYDTVSHYLFDDSFEDVPFGSFWVSGISVIAVLFAAAIPFLLVYWIIKFIGRW